MEALLATLGPTVERLHWLAHAGPRALADERVELPRSLPALQRSTVGWRPIGVVGVLPSWRSPWTTTVGALASALMAGNGVVFRAPPTGRLLGDRLGRIFERAGLPDRLLAVVHGDEPLDAALADSGVDELMRPGEDDPGGGPWAGGGGRGPMLVLADARVEYAAEAALWARFAAAGQTSAGVERVYVAREAADAFVAAAARGARALRVGDPRSFEVEIGPMVSAEALARAEALADEAVASGARRQCGGSAEVDGLAEAAFYAPEVLAGVTPAMRLAREPVAGPVLAVVEVESPDEAVALANEALPGAHASVWTRDRARSEGVCAALQARGVSVNDHPAVEGARVVAHGGTGWPGGRRRGRPRLDGVQPKVVIRTRWRPGARSPYPYDETLARATRASAIVRFGREADRPAALRAGALPLLAVAVRRGRRG